MQSYPNLTCGVSEILAMRVILYWKVTYPLSCDVEASFNGPGPESVRMIQDSKARSLESWYNNHPFLGSIKPLDIASSVISNHL